MISNIHTHTYRCHHAGGKDEDYVKRAIECGFVRLGFSDHVPFVFPDGSESDFRVSMSQAEDYISSINSLKEKYKDKIEIFVGFEMEYYPHFFDEMISNVMKWGADYLILGEHFIDNEWPDGLGSVYGSDKEEDLENYVDCVLAAMNSGYYTYIAHPDVFNFKGDEKIYDRHMRKICRKAAEIDMPLEINILGIGTLRHYPGERFFKIAAEEGAKAVIGSDAHEPEHVCDYDCIAKAEKLAKKCGIEIIEKPEIKLLH